MKIFFRAMDYLSLPTHIITILFPISEFELWMLVSFILICADLSSFSILEDNFLAFLLIGWGKSPSISDVAWVGAVGGFCKMQKEILRL